MDLIEDPLEAWHRGLREGAQRELARPPRAHPMLTFPMRRKHWAPPNAPRYRWTIVDGQAGWWHVEDLRRMGRSGAVLRFLPLPRPFNGGW